MSGQIEASGGRNLPFEPELLFDGFAEGQRLMRRHDELKGVLPALREQIYGGVVLQAIEGPKVYDMDASNVDPAVLQRLAGTEAAIRRINRDLTGREKLLAVGAVGRVVSAARLREGQDTIARVEMYGSLMDGGPEPTLMDADMPEVRGAISRVDLREGTIHLRPQKFSRTRLESGHYEVRLLGDDGTPAVRLETREKSWRDVTGLTFMDRVALAFTGR